MTSRDVREPHLHGRCLYPVAGRLGPLVDTKSQIGQGLYHGRDGHATKPSWHGRLAREGLGV